MKTIIQREININWKIIKKKIENWKKRKIANDIIKINKIDKYKRIK